VIEKSFDEMTGAGEINSQTFELLRNKGFLSSRHLVTMRISIIQSEGQTQPYLVFYREGTDWLFLTHRQFFGLLDGARFNGEGNLVDTDTKVMGQDVICQELVYVEFDLELLKAFAGFNEFKIRLGGLDFELNYEFRAAAAEALAAL
jgi:hypothetical protein